MTKILLVEDDKSLREIYGVRLLAEGYDIISAGDGEEALAMAIKDRPALIVSDVMMPKISGFDMLDILRSTTETREIRVIMMTALSSEDQRQRGVSLGADRYLVKSQVGIEDVVRTVHEVLGDAPTTSGNRQPQPAQMQPRAPTPPASAATAPGPSHPLPQPTAPFSTQRPANLGDRIIHPISSPTNGPVDFAHMMAAELGTTSSAAQPAPPAPAQPMNNPAMTGSIPPIPASSMPTQTMPLGPQPVAPLNPQPVAPTPLPPPVQPNVPPAAAPQPPTPWTVPPRPGV